MPDRRKPGGDPDPAPETALEAGELRRQRVEEIRREREHRTSHETARPSPTVRWKPPAELATTRSRKTLLRVLTLLVVVSGGYLAFRTLTRAAFAAKLIPLNASLPEGPVVPDDPVTVGIYARNEGPRQAMAYALLVLADGTETQGPPVPVPPGDSVLVPVEAAFPPGDQVATLLLYDAKTDAEITALHGLLVRSGVPQVDVASASVAPAAGAADSIVVSFELFNRAGWNATVVPIVVFTPTPAGPEPVEVGLPLARLAGGETLARRDAIAPGVVPPGRYQVTVVSVSPLGESTGRGVHGMPLDVSPEELRNDR